MICADCKNSYLSDPHDRKNLKTLSGLCEACGTQYQYSPFLRSLRRTLLSTFFSIEFIVLLFIGFEWTKLLVLTGLILLVYGVFHNLVNTGEKIRFKNKKERNDATRLQRFYGLILGFFIPIIMIFFVYSV